MTFHLDFVIIVVSQFNWENWLSEVEKVITPLYLSHFQAHELKSGVLDFAKMAGTTLVSERMETTLT